jgi:polar amino acid transport system substrate-binding protein
VRAFKVLVAVVVLVGGLGACGKHGAKNVYSCPNKGSGVGFQATKKGKLTVQTSLPAPHFWTGSGVDKLTGGYELTLAEDLCAQLGIGRVRIVDQPLSAIVNGQTSDFDVAIARLSTSATSAKGTYSTGYLDTDQGIVVDTGTTVPTLAAAQKLTWGYEAGTTSGTFLTAHVKPTAAAKSFASTSALFAALKAKRVQAILVPTPVALATVANGEQVVGQFATHEQFGVYLPSGSKNTKLVNTAIAKLKSNGTLDSLASKWLTGPAPASVPFITAP